MLCARDINIQWLSTNGNCQNQKNNETLRYEMLTKHICADKIKKLTVCPTQLWNIGIHRQCQAAFTSITMLTSAGVRNTCLWHVPFTLGNKRLSKHVKGMLCKARHRLKVEGGKIALSSNANGICQMHVLRTLATVSMVMLLRAAWR